MKKDGKGSKAKGASFERTISVGLSKWISGGAREDLIWRSAMSGGRATVSRKKGTELKSQSGDLSSIDPDSAEFLAKFYAELKNYKDLNFDGLLTNTGHLARFWQSTVAEANCYKKQPMLIVKQNNKPIVIFLQTRGMDMLALNPGQCVIIAPRLGAYGVLFDDFVKWARPF